MTLSLNPLTPAALGVSGPSRGDLFGFDGSGWTPVRPFFDVTLFGAVGDGVTDDSVALQACYDAIPDSGGVMLLPAGTYLGSFSMNDDKPTLVSGYGATLLVPNGQVGIDVQTGHPQKVVAIKGLLIDGQGGVGQQQGVTGIRVTNTDWVRMQDLVVQMCVVGIELLATGSSGDWVEATSVEQVFLYECDTGFWFHQDGATPSGSFLETALRDVGINSCTIAIDCSGIPGAGLQRCTFDNITIWLARTGDTGVKIGCAMNGADWNNIAFEQTVADCKSFDVVSGYDGLGEFSASFNSVPYTDRAVVAAGLVFRYKENNVWTVKLGSGADALTAAIATRVQGDTTDRARLVPGSPGGILILGDGEGNYTNWYYASPGAVKTDGEAAIGGTLSAAWNGSAWNLSVSPTQIGFFGTVGTGKPTVTGSRGSNAALASLLTALAGLGLITDSSS